MWHTYWLQDLWKIVCTLKTEKTQKIMAYHVIMHCDMDISEKKIYQQHSSNRHSFQLWRSPKNTALHHGKDQVLAYPPPDPLNLSLFDQHSSLQNEKQQKNKTKNYEKNLPYSLPTIKEKTTTNHALYYDRKCFLLSYNLWILKTKTKKIHPRKTRQRWTRNKLKAPS